MVDAPLIGPYQPDDILAWEIDGPRTAGQFLSAVIRLADSLPECPTVLNLLSSRYEFLIGFFAAVLRRQVTLLPQSHAPDTLRQIAKDYGAGYCLTNPEQPIDGLPCVGLPPRSPTVPWLEKVPSIPLSQVVAIAFTSGSTGTPSPNRKTWRALIAVAQATASRFGVNGGDSRSVVATVPHQHMFGLEASVMLPIQQGLVMHAGRPLFPEDVRTALEDVPGKAILVTTPFHLRACVSAPVHLPPLGMILSATAPLSRDLARQVELKFLAPVKEIFGFAEAGSIASRRTVETDDWLPLDGIVLGQEGPDWTIRASYLPDPVRFPDRVSIHDDGTFRVLGRADPVRFPDRVSIHDDGTFRVLGRAEDQVAVAGHRASLGDLNRTLLEIEGVSDGAFFTPDAQEDSVTRLMAFVVAPGKTEQDIQQALRTRIDPVFLPRPLVFVPRLPRNETGKLPREALRDLAERCMGKGSPDDA